jgi:hypothetical protein
VEIDIRIGAERKIVLDGNEVHVKSAELIERVRHGHAACAGPALVVAIETDMEKSSIQSDESKYGEHEPEHRESLKIRAVHHIRNGGRG